MPEPKPDKARVPAAPTLWNLAVRCPPDSIVDNSASIHRASSGVGSAASLVAAAVCRWRHSHGAVPKVASCRSSTSRTVRSAVLDAKASHDVGAARDWGDFPLDRTAPVTTLPASKLQQDPLEFAAGLRHSAQYFWMSVPNCGTWLKAGCPWSGRVRSRRPNFRAIMAILSLRFFQ